ncbi:MAG TPA: response regulator [Oscillatoriaceae cyanobacterium M33_DOE_052]|uniref:Response regulator n=1 Tax=Planktothricoides sp. SpSt-374 TaxID=2282167 RepID=A0A7C3ZME2_9CYAN|nr:response regulator [Oscillatoriaceae cyanobacterium M33_DOE_052]
MKKILVVDDSSTMRRMVKASLQKLAEVKFEEASTGLEAIERLVLSPVDLMVLDLNMPDMHGLDVLKFMREHQIYRNIPVIVLTTRNDDSSCVAALAAGASRYMTKPFETQVLAAQANILLTYK